MQFKLKGLVFAFCLLQAHFINLSFANTEEKAQHLFKRYKRMREKEPKNMENADLSRYKHIVGSDTDLLLMPDSEKALLQSKGFREADEDVQKRVVEKIHVLLTTKPKSSNPALRDKRPLADSEDDVEPETPSLLDIIGDKMDEKELGAKHVIGALVIAIVVLTASGIWLYKKFKKASKHQAF